MGLEHDSDFQSGTLIGVAALGLPDGATSFAAGILRRVFEAALGRDQVESSNWGSLCVPAFAVVTFYSTDRAAALRSIQSALTELDLVNHSISAYFDEAEMYWRSVHRGFAGEFGNFLTPEVMREANDRVESLSRVVQGLQAAVERLPAEGGAL